MHGLLPCRALLEKSPKRLQWNRLGRARPGRRQEIHAGPTRMDGHTSRLKRYVSHTVDASTKPAKDLQPPETKAWKSAECHRKEAAHHPETEWLGNQRTFGQCMPTTYVTKTSASSLLNLRRLAIVRMDFFE